MLLLHHWGLCMLLMLPSPSPAHGGEAATKEEEKQEKETGSNADPSVSTRRPPDVLRE